LSSKKNMSMWDACRAKTTKTSDARDIFWPRLAAMLRIRSTKSQYKYSKGNLRRIGTREGKFMFGVLIFAEYARQHD